VSAFRFKISISKMFNVRIGEQMKFLAFWFTCLGRSCSPQHLRLLLVLRHKFENVHVNTSQMLNWIVYMLLYMLVILKTLWYVIGSEKMLRFDNVRLRCFGYNVVEIYWGGWACCKCNALYCVYNIVYIFSSNSVPSRPV
jgi:hypothetical protein